MIKADAYGLGAERVGAALAAVGCRDFFVAQHDPWEVIRVIIEGRKRREIDPTLVVLRECVAQMAEDRETPRSDAPPPRPATRRGPDEPEAAPAPSVAPERRSVRREVIAFALGMLAPWIALLVAFALLVGSPSR